MKNYYLKKSRTSRPHRHLGDLEDPQVISDGPNNHGNPALSPRFVHETNQPSKRHRRSVDLTHEQASKNDFVEFARRSTNKEAVELHQQIQIDVFRFGGYPLRFTIVFMYDVDTHAENLNTKSGEKENNIRT